VTVKFLLFIFLDLSISAHRAQDRSTFSPVHLNHSDKGTTACNCIRLLSDDDEDGDGNNSNSRIAFFTSRDIQQGEELCFSYGNNFWMGRETDKQ
jgi:SET domain-containing protein